MLFKNSEKNHIGGHSRNSVRLDKALQIQNHDNRHC
jgi:hypothetical protein